MSGLSAGHPVPSPALPRSRSAQALVAGEQHHGEHRAQDHHQPDDLSLTAVGFLFHHFHTLLCFDFDTPFQRVLDQRSQCRNTTHTADYGTQGARIVTGEEVTAAGHRSTPAGAFSGTDLSRHDLNAADAHRPVNMLGDVFFHVLDRKAMIGAPVLGHPVEHLLEFDPFHPGIQVHQFRFRKHGKDP